MSHDIHRWWFPNPNDSRFGNLSPSHLIAENAVQCFCDCGHEVVVTENHLKAGILYACDCVDLNRKGRLRHGHCKHSCRSTEHNIWRAMTARCRRPTHPAYKYYGARGITVCQEWQDSFEQFLADMGPRPAGLTLERINNDRGYCPENCKWATVADQAKNKRPVENRNFTAPRYRLDFDKAREIRQLIKTYAAEELAKRYGCSVSAIHNVIYNRRWVETPIAV